MAEDKVYITGTTAREYNFGSFVTPKRKYTDDQILAGKTTVVSVPASQYSQLKTNKLFTSLIDQGILKVSKTKPTNAVTSVVEVRSTYEAEIAELKAQLEQKNTDYDALKQEALAAVEAAKTGTVKSEEAE